MSEVAPAHPPAPQTVKSAMAMVVKDLALLAKSMTEAAVIAPDEGIRDAHTACARRLLRQVVGLCDIFDIDRETFEVNGLPVHTFQTIEPMLEGGAVSFHFHTGDECVRTRPLPHHAVISLCETAIRMATDERDRARKVSN